MADLGLGYEIDRDKMEDLTVTDLRQKWVNNAEASGASGLESGH
jgi:hypothetical protein